MLNLVIYSPIPALRAGLRSLLTSDPDFEVVATGSILGAVTAIPGDAQVLIFTLDAIGDNPERALDALPDLPALLIADGDIPPIVLSRLGVSAPGEPRPWGLIAPDASAEALQAAVRALAEGLMVASPDLLTPLLSPLPLAGPPQDEDGDVVLRENLTEREIDVLREVAGGLTNKQIALALGISEHTVKFHVSSIYAKLGASNRTDAVRKGARRGFIPL